MLIQLKFEYNIYIYFFKQKYYYMYEYRPYFAIKDVAKIVGIN